MIFLSGNVFSCFSITQESFLEDVNCILNSGEVPDLFDNEEIDGIAMELKTAATVCQIPDTRADVYNFFVQVMTMLLLFRTWQGPCLNFTLS